MTGIENPGGEPEVLIGAAALVSGGRVLRPGWLRARGGRVGEAAEGPPPRTPDLDFGDAAVVPGFVDMHVHGGGGGTYTTGETDEILRAVAFHRRHGTTTTVASLVSAGPDALLRQVRALREPVAEGLLAGIHLEGPWISHGRCGAHDPSVLRDPDQAEIARLLEAGEGSIIMVTVAPELYGALEAITALTVAGVVVAVGHTDATYEQARAAIAAGARVGTHLFNAMRPLHHREPGPVLALLEDERVTVELVGDGVHVHDGLVAHVAADIGPRRIALVTDAMVAAGMADGAYRLGSLDVQVTDGIARVGATGAIAGSTATMASLFERAVRRLPGPVDEVLVAVTDMTSSTPARTLGLDDVGDLVPGRQADWVVVRDGRVREVYRRAQPVGTD
ncbi:N-acetylglucosamine-6-phosphate deacetylase [Gordonia iterans]|uniref:N-acetylglucosamine-6-phosphate deacetylase n=1 Tax=Gordonia iterans TaxID=1004901 RepID=UPI001F2BD007|nr:amidohydrolase family protein [Gordonia iterans]